MAGVMKKLQLRLFQLRNELMTLAQSATGFDMILIDQLINSRDELKDVNELVPLVQSATGFDVTLNNQLIHIRDELKDVRSEITALYAKQALLEAKPQVEPISENERKRKLNYDRMVTREKLLFPIYRIGGTY